MENFDYDAELERIEKEKEKRAKELEEKQAEAYGKAKAESETNAVSNIVLDTQKTIQSKLNNKLANHIDTDKGVEEKIKVTADKLVDKGLEAQNNESDALVIDSEDKVLDADYKKNKDEYLYHGIDHKVDKKWKRKLLLVINDIWFVIWAIVSCFTIVPVSTFLSRIKALKGIVKGCAIILGIVLLLGCLAGLTFWVLKSTGLVH